MIASFLFSDPFLSLCVDEPEAKPSRSFIQAPAIVPLLFIMMIIYR